MYPTFQVEESASSITSEMANKLYVNPAEEDFTCEPISK